MLYVIAAPSGTGKTTIVNEILKRKPEIIFSVSATTRKKRENETDGKDYFFFSKEEFEKYTLLPDLYLICCPDLPWEFDPLRENPHELELLFLLHYQKVLESKTAYCLIQGVGTKRINQAIIK